MNPWFVRNCILRPVYALRGEHVFEYIRDVRAFNARTISSMQDEQWRKLSKLIEFAYHNNSHYRKCMTELGLKPSEIRDRNDFAELPFLTKDIINRRSESLSSSGRFRVSRRKTSGSTGTPLRFVKDRDASAYMDAVMHDCYSWHGIQVGDRQARVWGIPLDSYGSSYTRLKDLLLNRKRLVAFEIRLENSVEFYKKLRRFRPKFMYGLVNTMCEFGSQLLSASLEPRDLGIEVIITTGEILYPNQRSFLSDTFGSRVVNEYGTTENGIVAFECSEGNLHVMAHNIYLEIIDPSSGEPAQEGELGEIVITELHSFAMPFVRYRVGDMAVPTSEQCSCGLGLPIVKEIVGRVSDLIVTPEGKRISSAIMSYSMPKGVRRFRSYQRSVDRLDVLIERGEDLSEKDITFFLHQLEQYLGTAIHVEIKTVDRIPIDSSGKFRHFVSELD